MFSEHGSRRDVGCMHADHVSASGHPITKLLLPYGLTVTGTAKSEDPRALSDRKISHILWSK